jgi:hypothetical protein
MEDDLKILKVEYLSNHLLDHTQIFNLYEDNLQWKNTLTYQKWNISATAYTIILKF